MRRKKKLIKYWRLVMMTKSTDRDVIKMFKLMTMTLVLMTNDRKQITIIANHHTHMALISIN